MNNNLTQKEKMLLEDQKKHEELCIQKYQNYATQTQCQELKQLFNNYANQEQQHLNTINQILNGQVPNVSQQSNQGGQQSTANYQTNPSTDMTLNSNSQLDMHLCQDALTTEKYISGAYDTSIFEFTNSQLRQVLNHIQKEEQQHGEGIFNYMQSKGMYNPQ
ncbi:MAG: coat protein F [Peptococcaceae bacterium BICA1-8]|nr:MAG: coat protein F [Peptococcaceae bacterium BICA1-8]